MNTHKTTTKQQTKGMRARTLTLPVTAALALMAVGIGTAAPVGRVAHAQQDDPGALYRAVIPGALVSYSGPYARDHGTRTYLYTVRYPAHPGRAGGYEVWAGARSAGVAEVINGANYRAALAMARPYLVFTAHKSGVWTVVERVLGTCTVEAGLYRARNVMLAEVKAPTCQEAYAAAGPAFTSVAEAIF